MKLSVIKLYEGTRGEEIGASELASYLGETFSVKVEIEGDFWLEHGARAEDTALQLASIKVIDPARQELNPDPLFPEIEFEKRRLTDASVKSSGVFYDGTRLLSIYWKLIPEDQRRDDICHIILTRELFGTWDPDDLRWHARPIILGYPCLVSTTGIVEGPARPPRFYLMRNAGVNIGSLEKEMGGQFIHEGDERMTEVLKGYCAQAAYYSITGEAFCDDPGCRLYNAHWQSELIYAQITCPHEFCERHTRQIAEIEAENRK